MIPYRESISEVNIDDFAMDFIKGNLPYGDYFKHLKVSFRRDKDNTLWGDVHITLA